MAEKSNLSLNIKEDILSDSPGSSAGKESTYNARDPGSIPGSGRSTGEGISYPLLYTWSSLVAQLVKEYAYNAGDPGSIPGLGRTPGERKGFQSRLIYSQVHRKRIYGIEIVNFICQLD